MDLAIPKAQLPERIIAILLSLAVSVLSIAVLFRVFYASVVIAKNPTQYMVVSSRPQIEDFEFVRASEQSDRFKYIRSTEPFADTLRTKLGLASAQAAPVRVFQFNKGMAQSELAPSESISTVLQQIKLEHDRQFVPWIAMAACAGIGLGLLLQLNSILIGPLLLCASGLALAKALTQCPTCPNLKLAGVDLALLGAALFALLAVGITLNKSLSAKRISAIIAGRIVIWQVSASWVFRDPCTPCTCIALILSLLVSASIGWNRFEPAPASRFTSSIAWTAALIPAILIFARSAKPLDALTDGQPVTHLLTGTPQHIASLKQLGMQSLGRKAVVYVGHEGCHPCIDGLAAIDGSGISGLTFAFIGSNPPDTRRKWVQIPNGADIRVTPSLLFVDSDGTVVSQELGFATNVDALISLSKRIEQFSQPQPRKGRSTKNENAT